MSRLIETHSTRNPRILTFYGMLAVMVLTLVGGLVWRQLLNRSLYSERERLQNERRIIFPGPRGNILDRHGRILVQNRPRFSVVLNLAELRGELRNEGIKIMRNYRDYEKADRPTPGQLERIARAAVAQRYLDQVNFVLGRTERINPRDLDRHFSQNLLLPYTLVDNLTPEEYARLLERLEVKSPLQVFASSTRYYPYGAAAAHVLGYVGIDNDPVAEDFPGDDLLTFKMKGAFGRDGLEKKFDEYLQGEAGGAIYRVDPAGYKVDLPVEKRLPVQGHNLTTSLDADLQLAAEEAMGEQNGCVVAIDVHTGEILAMSSKPNYDLNAFVPRLSEETAKKIDADGAWMNKAIGGLYPPGSTFKIITSIAGMRSGRIGIHQHMERECQGAIMVGNKRFTCDNGEGHHGSIDLAEAIATSCDVYFYQAGQIITPDIMAAEARRFHLDQRTDIELAGETNGMIIPDPEWKERIKKDRWYPGDTANMAIGQGFVLVSPIDMACFAASVARDELYTKPTILHDPNAPVQHAPPIGLTSSQRATLLAGMEGCTTYGTASIITKPGFKIPGVRIAGKTGTAQKKVTKDGVTGNINFAWFICFAPLENPEIAIAVVIEGDQIGENFAGGLYSAPAANAILKKYFEKKEEAAHPSLPSIHLK